MKKRLFISSILMTLVLLVAITTATFAWYSVSQATVTDGTQTNAVATAKNEITAGSATLSMVVTYHNFSNQALTTDNDNETPAPAFYPLLPATNAGDATTAPIFTGLESELTASWKSYVKQNTSNIPYATSSTDCAYIKIVYTLTVNTAGDDSLGNYVLTLSKQAGFASTTGLVGAYLIGVEEDGVNEFAALPASDPVVTNVNLSASSQTVTVLLWLNGQNASLPADAVATPVNVLQMVASVHAN